MTRPSLSYGADIELFVEGKDGEIVPADIAIPLLEDTMWYAAYSYDTACFEYQLPVCSSIPEFVHLTRKCIAGASDYIQARGGTAITVPQARIAKHLLDQSRYGSEFGCKPDYNAYNPKHSRRLKACDYGEVRTAGGHLHIGVPTDTKLSKWNLVKVLDAYLRELQEYNHRGMLFPTGTFRPTSYGVEYRVLSNCWANGYSKEFMIVIDALRTLEAKWDKLQELDAELEDCLNVHSVVILLLNKGVYF